MAVEGIFGKVTGIADLKAALSQVVPKLRKRALRNALAAGGRVFRDEARRLVPVLKVPVRRKGQVVRKTGTVRKAITVRTSKRVARGDVGVFVNVRPAKKGARGSTNPNDPFYWRWLEFGSRVMRAFGFLQGAARSRMGQALNVFEKTIGPAIDKLNKKDAQP